jgi:uncharacterized protein (TIGR03067 family)
MFRLGLLMTVVAAFPWPAARADDKPKTDLDALQGTWVMTATTTGGEKGEPDKGAKLVVKGDAHEMTVNGLTMKGRVKLDPKADPKAVDLTIDGAPADAVFRAVYKLDGGELVLCFAPTFQGRPKKVESTKENGAVLSRWAKK